MREVRRLVYKVETQILPPWFLNRHRDLRLALCIKHEQTDARFAITAIGWEVLHFLPCLALPGFVNDMMRPTLPETNPDSQIHLSHSLGTRSRYGRETTIISWLDTEGKQSSRLTLVRSLILLCSVQNSWSGCTASIFACKASPSPEFCGLG